MTQIRLMKVINVRLEQTGDLPIPFYFRLYSITSAYLQECEMINPAFAFNGAGNVLSEWFNNHVNYFVHRVHVNSVKSMINECMKENWKVTDKSGLFAPAQTIINEFIGYGEYITLNGSSGFSGDTWLKDFDFMNQMIKKRIRLKIKMVVKHCLCLGLGPVLGLYLLKSLLLGNKSSWFLVWY